MDQSQPASCRPGLRRKPASVPAQLFAAAPVPPKNYVPLLIRKITADWIVIKNIHKFAAFFINWVKNPVQFDFI
jgi:hypothetical protein